MLWDKFHFSLTLFYLFFVISISFFLHPKNRGGRFILFEQKEHENILCVYKTFVEYQINGRSFEVFKDETKRKAKTHLDLFA